MVFGKKPLVAALATMALLLPSARLQAALNNIILSNTFEDCLYMQKLFDCTHCNDLENIYPYDPDPTDSI